MRYIIQNTVFCRLIHICLPQADTCTVRVDQLTTKLFEDRFFSIMIDGSTDSGALKMFKVVYILHVYLDLCTGVVTSFISIGVVVLMD